LTLHQHSKASNDFLLSLENQIDTV
jgi:hypothetical protein